MRNCSHSSQGQFKITAHPGCLSCCRSQPIHPTAKPIAAVIGFSYIFYDVRNVDLGVSVHHGCSARSLAEADAPPRAFPLPVLSPPASPMGCSHPAQSSTTAHKKGLTCRRPRCYSAQRKLPVVALKSVAWKIEVRRLVEPSCRGDGHQKNGSGTPKHSIHATLQAVNTKNCLQT
jgi:hypothetical protein